MNRTVRNGGERNEETERVGEKKEILCFDPLQFMRAPINRSVLRVLTARYVAGMVAVGGRVEVVGVASAAGVGKRLTQPGTVVEIPALNPVTTVARIQRQETLSSASRLCHWHQL